MRPQPSQPIFQYKTADQTAKKTGAPGETRTHTGRVLNPLPLPIGLPGLKSGGCDCYRLRRTRGRSIRDPTSTKKSAGQNGNFNPLNRHPPCCELSPRVGAGLRDQRVMPPLVLLLSRARPERRWHQPYAAVQQLLDVLAGCYR